MRRKNLIIIPGSCSDRLNWFDQIRFYENKGWQVGFLDLNAEKYLTMQRCAHEIESALDNLINEDTVIMAHSMGAMLMFRVLVNSKNLRLQNLLKKIKIFFIQMPCDSSSVKGLRFTAHLTSPAIFLHKLLINWWLEPVLYALKYLVSIFGYNNILVNIPNLILNFIAMNTSFWKASPREFLSLIRYYRNWQKFFDYSEADLSDYKNLYFTYGQPDPVCNSALIEAMGEKYPNINLLKMPLGFHNPHHMFWHQAKFDKLILVKD